VTGRFLWHARELGRATAAGHAQVLFSESPLGGLLLLLGLVPIAPRAAASAVLACAIATCLAQLRRYPRPEWRRGLYGYGAALAGVFWGLLFAPGAATWLALVAAALLTPPLTRLAHRLLTPREVPALALPALVLTWFAALFLDAAPTDATPGISAQVAAWTLTLAGLALSSRLLLVTALLGVAVGLLLSAVVGDASRAGVLANSVPTAVALGSVLLPLSPASLGLAAFASAVAGVFWWSASGLLALPLPPLVAPFNLVTIATLLALRAVQVRRLVPGRPAPLPLAAISSPDAARCGELARRRLLDLAGQAEKICVLTGAGVSRASGLPDFRGPSGPWTRTRRITLTDFVQSPELRRMYWREEERFFRLIERARPAATHLALADLHRRGRLSAVVTQNVDGLHQAAGTPPEAVIELHGAMRQAFCLDCGREVPRAPLSRRITLGAAALYCVACQGLLNGGSIMFGEPVSPARLDAALRAVLASDLLLVLGSSLLVAPASDLLRWARDAGIPIAIVNATPTPYDRHATLSVAAEVGAFALDLLDVLRCRSKGPPVGSGRPGLAQRV
jgi:NAD-dependent deacetylase